MIAAVISGGPIPEIMRVEATCMVEKPMINKGLL